MFIYRQFIQYYSQYSFRNVNYSNVFFFILACSILLSCKPNYTNNETILRAESLLTTKPDSAYLLLCSIKQPGKLTQADYAAWCLNYTHAQYKLYMDIKSDSVINVAVKYYSRSKLYKYSGTAYYLSGCIAKMHQKNKEAMLAYKKAGELLSNTNEVNLKGLVEFNIGSCYFQNELFSESLIHFKKSLKYFERSKNKHYQAYSYRALSDTYHQMGNSTTDKMMFLEKAIKLSKESGDSIYYYDNLARKGELLYNTNFSESTKYLLQGFIHLPQQRAYYAGFLSYTYSKMNKTDSSKYYLNIAKADTVESSTKKILYLAAAYVKQSEGNHNEAFRCLESAYNLRDSIYQKNIHNQLYRIDKQYDLARKERENAVLRIANQQKVIIITLLALAVFIVLVILLIIQNRNKQKQAAYELEKQRLEFEIETKKAENELKRKLLRIKLSNKIENTLQLNKLKLGFLDNEKHNEFIAKITKQSVISPNEWQYYIDEVNQLLDGKITSFRVEYAELTPSDLIVIALICLGIDITNSCILLNMSSNTMYTRRRRIKSKIVLGKDIDLEEWLEQNIVTDK